MHNRMCVVETSGAGVAPPEPAWSPRRPAATAAGLFAGVILALTGCSGTPGGRTGAPDDAKQVVATVLDAWKSGQKPADLQSAKPAVRVADEDWDAGRSLKSYELQPAEEHGGHWRVPALLTVSPAGGTDAQVRTAYAVTMQPSISVVRVDDFVE